MVSLCRSITPAQLCSRNKARVRRCCCMESMSAGNQPCVSFRSEQLMEKDSLPLIESQIIVLLRRLLNCTCLVMKTLGCKQNSKSTPEQSGQCNLTRRFILQQTPPPSSIFTTGITMRLLLCRSGSCNILVSSTSV